MLIQLPLETSFSLSPNPLSLLLLAGITASLHLILNLHTGISVSCRGCMISQGTILTPLLQECCTCSPWLLPLRLALASTSLFLSDLACGLALPVPPFQQLTGKPSATVHTAGPRQSQMPCSFSLLLPLAQDLMQKNNHFSLSLP